MSKVRKLTKNAVLERHLLMSKNSSSRDCSTIDSIDAENPARTRTSLRFQEVSLRFSDVRLLQGPHELNERLVGFHYAYLQSRQYKMHPDLHFLMPALIYSLRNLELRERRRLARGLQLAVKQFIFMPIAQDSHWSLLLFARPDRKFYYFDSGDNQHVNHARLLYEYLQVPLGAEDYAFSVGRCLQQGTGQNHESGVYLMCMTDNMADYVTRCGYATRTLLTSIQEVRTRRASMLQLIRTLGGILPATSSSKSSSISSSES